MNAAAFAAISRSEASHYVGPINPPVILWQKALSKFRRVAGSQGSFFFFSQRFGQVEMPARDAYAGGKEFAFISTNFEAKGGRSVLSAFQELRKRHTDVSLIVVGDKPAGVAPQPRREVRQRKCLAAARDRRNAHLAVAVAQDVVLDRPE